MIRDLRRSLRLLSRQPFQTAIAVLALALGIGFVAALFSIADGTLLRDLSLPAANRLMYVGRRNPRTGRSGVRVAEFQAWERHQRSFSSLAAWNAYGMVLTGDQRAAAFVNGALVSYQFFRTFGVQPLLGRVFLPEEDREGVQKVVVISYELWRQRYQGDLKVVGKPVRLGGDPATVIGVMPQGFRFPLDQDFWMPLAGTLPLVAQRGEALEVCGKLREGVSQQTASVELDGLAYGVRIGSETPGEAHTVILPFTEGYTAAARRPLRLMTGAVLGILLISCANGANLMLARGAQRAHELTVRIALGASRGSLVVALLSESFLIAALGLLAGLGVGMVCIELYKRSGGLVQASWANVALGPRSLLVALGVTLASALLSGFVPAWRAARLTPGESLKDESRGGTSRSLGRWASGLVMVQVTLTCVLLAGTGQMIASVHNLYRHDFGEEPERVWTTLMILDSVRSPTASSWLRFYEELQRDLMEIPGVRSVALTSHLPSGSTPRSRVEIEGKSPAGEATARWSVVSAGFFRTLGRPVTQGRDFIASDSAQRPLVVLVNRSFVHRYFPVDNPLGHRIRFTDGSAPRSWATIVGVVSDLYLSWDESNDHLDSEHPEGLYFSMAQRPLPGAYLAVRGKIPPAAVERQLRRVLARLDPNVPPMQSQTLAASIDQSLVDYRALRSLLTVLGLAALILAAIGLFAVVDFAVNQRRREIGIRMALGARRSEVARLVVNAGMVRVVLGAIAGVAGATVFSRLLETFLFGVEPGNPVILGAAVLLLILVAAVACALPAWRAARTDPLLVLRSE